MTMQQRILDFYKRSTAMTSPGRYASMLGELPSDVSKLARVIPGLILYEMEVSGNSDWLRKNI